MQVTPLRPQKDTHRKNAAGTGLVPIPLTHAASTAAAAPGGTHPLPTPPGIPVPHGSLLAPPGEWDPRSGPASVPAQPPPLPNAPHALFCTLPTHL